MSLFDAQTQLFSTSLHCCDSSWRTRAWSMLHVQVDSHVVYYLCEKIVVVIRDICKAIASMAIALLPANKATDYFPELKMHNLFVGSEYQRSQQLFTFDLTTWLILHLPLSRKLWESTTPPESMRASSWAPQSVSLTLFSSSSSSHSPPSPFASIPPWRQ